jgi:hypothetical protein
VSNLRRATFNLPYPEGSWPYKAVNETVSTFVPVTDFVDAPFAFTLEKGLVTNIQVEYLLGIISGCEVFRGKN